MLQETKILTCDLCNKNQYQTVFSIPFVGINGGGSGFYYSFCDNCLKSRTAFGLLLQCIEQIDKWCKKNLEENYRQFGGRNWKKKLEKVLAKK